MTYFPISSLAIGLVAIALGIGVTSCTDTKTQTPTPGMEATVNLGVSGMTCAGCSSAITETLQPIPGVKSVVVDHEKGTAVIVTDGTAELPQKITSTINELGFEATLQ